jgi:hypothetical protein
LFLISLLVYVFVLFLNFLSPFSSVYVSTSVVFHSGKPLCCTHAHVATCLYVFFCWYTCVCFTRCFLCVALCFPSPLHHPPPHCHHCH